MSGGAPGFYGKLPGKGDFVSCRLSQGFIQPWDSWLQNVISCSREQLGEDWLDTYLTSPIWRFVLSPDTLTADSWAGILMPSVDRVGRYFPFTIAVPMNLPCPPLQFVEPAETWFAALEEIALAALDDSTDLQDLDDGLVALGAPDIAAPEGYRGAARPGRGKLALRASYGGDYAASLLSQLLKDTAPCLGVWWSQGSDRVEPSLLIADRLPPVTGFASLLDGDWERWGWGDGEPTGVAAIRVVGGGGGGG